MSRRWVCRPIALALPCLVACGGDAPRTSYRPLDLWGHEAGSRVELQVRFDTMWTYRAEDHVLASASRVEAFPNGDAAVLDIVGQQVHRIGPQGVMWSWGHLGQGPRELRNARAMTVGRNGDVVIVDSGNRKLVWLSSSGQWLRERALPPAKGKWVTGTTRGIVALNSGRYVLYGDGPDPWVLYSESGQIQSPVPSPWDGFDGMHPLQTQGVVAGAHDERWVFGFSLGNGFFVFSGLETLGSFSYVEHFGFPTVVATRSAKGGFSLSYAGRPTQSANDLIVQDETLLVLTRSRLLDRYDLNTGVYEGTVTLPGRARRVASWDGGLLVVDGSKLVPTVVSMRSTPSIFSRGIWTGETRKGGIYEQQRVHEPPEPSAEWAGQLPSLPDRARCLG